MIRQKKNGDIALKVGFSLFGERNLSLEEAIRLQEELTEFLEQKAEAEPENSALLAWGMRTDHKKPFNPDWDMLEAAQLSLREHMEMIKALKEALYTGIEITTNNPDEVFQQWAASTKCLIADLYNLVEKKVHISDAISSALEVDDVNEAINIGWLVTGLPSQECLYRSVEDASKAAKDNSEIIPVFFVPGISELNGLVYTCVGKGGNYKKIGMSTGAGASRGETLIIYKDTLTGALYHRTPFDFMVRMQMVKKAAI